jgi:hypothetical protein
LAGLEAVSKCKMYEAIGIIREHVIHIQNAVAVVIVVKGSAQTIAIYIERVV